MERINALFVVKEQDYACTMAECMRGMKIPIDFTVFLPDCTIDDDKFIKEFDVIITDDKAKVKRLYGIEKNHGICDKSGNIVELVESLEEETYGKIYKYRSLTDIADMIAAYSGRKVVDISKDINNKERGKRKAIIYAVTSGKGGTGCSSIAMGIARDFAVAGGEKVLYMSVGDVHSERSFFAQKSEGNIKEYIYELLYAKLPFYQNHISYFNKDIYGVSSFGTISAENIFMQLSAQDFETFIKAVSIIEDFDRIVIDVGNSRLKSAEYIKEIADGIFYVKTKERDILSCELLDKEKELFGNKLMITENFKISCDVKFEEFFEEQDKEEQIIKEEADVFIVEDEEAFYMVDGLMEIDLSGKFGKSIREIVEYSSSAFCL